MLRLVLFKFVIDHLKMPPIRTTPSSALLSPGKENRNLVPTIRPNNNATSLFPNRPSLDQPMKEQLKRSTYDTERELADIRSELDYFE